MSGPERRPVTRGIAVFCALLDAAAFRLDFSAAAGQQSLLRGPLAIGLRSTSSVLRFWNTCWVGRYLGMGWMIRTFRTGKLPRP